MIITVSTTISMGHRLPSYDGICSSPHGHNVKIMCDVDPLGAFLDFKKLQDELRALVEPMDHAMVLYRQDPLLSVLRDQFNFRVYVMEEEPTTEALAWEIFREMRLRNYNVVRLTVHETDKYSATCTLNDLHRFGVAVKHDEI